MKAELMMAVRSTLALGVALAAWLGVWVSGASAMPLPAKSAVSTDVRTVQDRFLPRLFGRGEQAPADAGVRIDQLEAEVRRLTGELEQLRFTVQQLQQQMGQRAALAAPPPQAEPQVRQRSDAAPAPEAPEPEAEVVAIPSGPIDLSALNTRFDDAALGGFGSAPVRGSVVQRDVALDNPRLSEARMLMQNGRYKLAMEKVTGLLGANPSGAEASEARFLAGEVLMAQGDLRGAANYFLENYTTDPNGRRAPESLVQLSRAFNQLGEGQAACSSIEELFGAYPNVAPGLREQAERERQAARCS